MSCLPWSHNWTWPRRRGSRDMQTCLRCGTEREALVQFDGPHYKRTQEAQAVKPAPAPRADLERCRAELELMRTRKRGD